MPKITVEIDWFGPPEDEWKLSAGMVKIALEKSYGKIFKKDSALNEVYSNQFGVKQEIVVLPVQCFRGVTKERPDAILVKFRHIDLRHIFKSDEAFEKFTRWLENSVFASLVQEEISDYVKHTMKLKDVGDVRDIKKNNSQ